VTPPDLDQAEVHLGFGVTISNLRIGAKGGYFFRDEDEWGLIPIVGLRLGNLLLVGEAKVLGEVRWYGASLSWLSNQ
jgi:hypothetical protein